MIRLITLAAVAFMAAAPANAETAQSVRVSLAGKSAEKIHADIIAASRQVCRRATHFDTFVVETTAHCVKATITAAVVQLNDAEVTALAAEAGR